MNKIIFICLILLAATAAANAQIAQGGTYKLEQAVVGTGGGTSSDAGNVYKIEGTVGQPAAGVTSTAPNYSLKGGFWSAQLAPTAALVSVSGRVTIENSNKGILNVRVTMTDASGATRDTLTTAGGRYRFDDLAAGQTYIFTVNARRYTFSQPTVVHSAIENFDELNFVATPQF